MNNHHHIERHTKLRRVIKIGEYWLIVNIDKKEFLHPHKFGDGMKLGEIASSSNGILAGLTILLADDNNPKLDLKHEVAGRWAGDKIVIVGDYGAIGKYEKEMGVRFGGENLFEYIETHGEDISEKVLSVMCEDDYLKDILVKRAEASWIDSPLRKALRKIGLEISMEEKKSAPIE